MKPCSKNKSKTKKAPARVLFVLPSRRVSLPLGEGGKTEGFDG